MANNDTYIPNFNDPRVQSRITHALGFVLGVMSTDTPKQWSTRFIDKHLGQSQRPLGKYLRDQLLICVDTKYSKDLGTCKSYILNEIGVLQLKQQLINKKESNQQIKLCNGDPNGSNIDNKLTIPTLYPSVSEVQYDSYLVNKFIEKEYKNQLETGNFDYNFKSNRYWHNLQSVKNEYRADILRNYGYQYNYDIEACAPTLLLQHSRHLGNDIWLPNLDEYLNNKQDVRQKIAKNAELDEKQAKVLINALFCGARLGNNKQFAISQLLNHDKAKIEYIKQDKYIKELRQEIKTIWSYITPTMTRVVKNKRLKPISSRQKWAVYFEQECKVISAIKRYIKQKQIKCFLEHDGWVCEQKLDQQQLLDWVKQHTGYEIKLKLEKR